jgi:signal transduction histidine kinase
MSQITADQTSPPSLNYLIPFQNTFSPRARRLLIILASTLLLAILCWVDLATGPHVHLGLLYVVPVLVATWYAGRWEGYALTIAASVAWFYAGRPVTDGSAVAVNAINLLIRGAFYLLLVECLAKIRNFGRALEKSVLERTTQLQLQIIERQRAQESLRILAGQLSEAEDVERRRIAYDIHDALSQMLGLAKMNLETVVAETPTDSRQFDRLTDVVKVMNDLIRQTREMTFDLHPSMLDHFGLVPTLQRFAEDFQRRTMSEVTINEFGERLELSSTLASYLFRAIKEVVNNSVKHGNAKEIIVAIHWEIGHMRCVVDDDGCGFDTAKALAPNVRRGLGLAGMDERLTSLGGKLGVESQPGSGARLILEVPVTQIPVTAQ